MRSKAFKEEVMGHRQRIREKFAENGPGVFADYELLELLLTYAIPRCDVKPVAKALLTKYKTISAIVDKPLEELEQEPGLGRNSALLFKILRGVLVRYLEQDLQSQTYLGAARDFADYARVRLGECVEEVVLVFYLNNQNFLIEAEILTSGTTDKVSVYPSVIAKKSLLKGAKSVVVCHNHPGGIVQPSGDDNMVTMEIRRALSAVNVFLLDHIIVSKFDYHSYREAEQNCRIGRILEPLE